MTISWLPIAVLATSPFVGSFLGVLVDRLPRAESAAVSRSRCRSCDKELGARDLVPILSWLFLRGRCRYCRSPIGREPLLMEGAAIGIAVWACLTVDVLVLIPTACFGWILLTLAIIDGRHLLLPDALIGCLAAAGLVTFLFLDPVRLPHHLAGAAIGYLSLTALAFIYRHIRGREGLGKGDPKLFGALGLWVSWGGLPGLLLLAAILGLSVAFARRMLGSSVEIQSKLPLGSFLAASGWIVWLYGPVVIG